MSLAQFDTERLLENALQRHGGLVQYGWSLTGLSDDAGRVCARVQPAGGEEWASGADGWLAATAPTAWCGPGLE